MTAFQKNAVLAKYLSNRGITLSLSDIDDLRRAQLTLHRWSEQECGDSNNCMSWAIERDETTGKTYMVYYPNMSKSYRRSIADRETGALKRIAKICTANGIHFFHQGDCRGCSLYIGSEVLTDQNYSNRGIAMVA